MRIHLMYEVTTTPDLSGPHYYVAAGKKFDPVEYANSRKLNAASINRHDVFNVSFALAMMKPGEWLIIMHEPPEE